IWWDGIQRFLRSLFRRRPRPLGFRRIWWTRSNRRARSGCRSRHYGHARGSAARIDPHGFAAPRRVQQSRKLSGQNSARRSRRTAHSPGRPGRSRRPRRKEWRPFSAGAPRQASRFFSREQRSHSRSEDCSLASGAGDGTESADARRKSSPENSARNAGGSAISIARTGPAEHFRKTRRSLCGLADKYSKEIVGARTRDLEPARETAWNLVIVMSNPAIAGRHLLLFLF